MPQILNNLISFLTQKRFLRRRYSTRQLLNAFTHEILTVLNLQELMEVTVTSLMRIMKLESTGILLHDKYGREYLLAASNGLKSRDVRLSDQNVLIRYLMKSERPILLDKKTEKTSAGSPLKESFEKLSARLCLPLQVHDELIGVLFLGRKKSGEEFTPEDLDILSALARTEAIAISNARLFDELSKMQNEIVQREKMAVIGTLAAGINHEICNPLSIIRGECEIFLLNYRDHHYREKTHEEILEIFMEIMRKVIREADRAAAITKRLASFAKPSAKASQETVNLEKEVDEVLGLMAHDIMSRNVIIRKDFPENYPPVSGDRKQIDEALFNVLRNCVQHSDKPKGWISIRASRETDFAAICVEDNGSGMPAEKIENIFNPFYASRESGTASDLGLFIVKQIMEQLKGSVAVQSEEGVGSIFVLRFPLSNT